MNFSTLKNLKPEEFKDAAKAYKSVSSMASLSKDRVEQRDVPKMRRLLEGKSLLAAVKQFQQIYDNFHYIQIECGLASTALNSLAHDLSAAKKKLNSAISDAESQKLTVNSDGSVTYPPAGEEVDGRKPEGGTVQGNAPADGSGGSKPIAPSGDSDSLAKSISKQAANASDNPKRRAAQECADRIARAIKEATEADQEWAPKLRRLRADDDLRVSAKDWVDTAKDGRTVGDGLDGSLNGVKPPRNGTPEENAKWWKSLTKEEREAYVAIHPASVGALDGLPAEVRDEANRTVLVQKKANYQIELDSLPPPPTGPQTWDKNAKRREELKGALRGMNAIQDRFDRTGSRGLPEAYLLGFDPKGEGNGKIILANGNPDHADHTATYVPGTLTDIEGIGKDINRMENLWETSRQLNPTASVSTIMWLDYDAPDNPVTESPSGKYAKEGSGALRSFLEGNNVAHGEAAGGKSHTTVIGHSYGSVLVGEAALGQPEGQPLADDIVAAGSPGMKARNPEELGIDRRHMWAAEAGGSADWATRELGRYGHGAGFPPVIPTDPEFGANILDSDASDHGSYWDPEKGTKALENQAAITLGQYDDVQTK
ncbi:alpha/beta hydrolase [Streptomyces smyrnaeus]|uniref:alpha/beta hydrolase n=1 Tax=Streptomyces smyrnaeus TaxID=1387713 RepID=UPI0033B361F3